jgi:hypothetical protein
MAAYHVEACVGALNSIETGQVEVVKKERENLRPGQACKPEACSLRRLVTQC